MDPRQRVGIGAAGIALVIFMALLTPWWTVSVSGNFGGGDESSGPFDDDLITAGQAALAGLLVLFAFLGAAGAAALRFLRSDKDRIADFALLGAGALVLLVVVLAATTWPGSDFGFWDSASSSGVGPFFGDAFSFEASTYADFGWYAALVATIGAIAVGLWGIQSGPAPVGAQAPAASPPAALANQPAAVAAAAPAATPSTAPGKCQGVTQRGTPCSRNATQGSHCATHA